MSLRRAVGALAERARKCRWRGSPSLWHETICWLPRPRVKMSTSLPTLASIGSPSTMRAVVRPQLLRSRSKTRKVSSRSVSGTLTSSMYPTGRRLTRLGMKSQMATAISAATFAAVLIYAATPSLRRSFTAPEMQRSERRLSSKRG